MMHSTHFMVKNDSERRNPMPPLFVGDVAPWWSVHLWCDRSSDQSLIVDTLSYFSFQS